MSWRHWSESGVIAGPLGSEELGWIQSAVIYAVDASSEDSTSVQILGFHVSKIKDDNGLGFEELIPSIVTIPQT